MKKLKKILTLSDPYPDIWYELSCYLKTILGLTFIIIGFFFLLSPLFKKGLIILGFFVILGPLGEKILAWEGRVFAQNFEVLSLTFGTLFIVIGLWFFWKIKLVRKLIKTLFS